MRITVTWPVAAEHFSSRSRAQDAADLGAAMLPAANAVHASLEPSHLSVWIKEPPA